MIDKLEKGGGCHDIWFHLQTVVMELFFRVESFYFDDFIACVRKISEGLFGSHLQTWVQCIGERGRFGGEVVCEEIVRNPFRHASGVDFDE